MHVAVLPVEGCITDMKIKNAYFEIGESKVKM